MSARNSWKKPGEPFVPFPWFGCPGANRSTRACSTLASVAEARARADEASYRIEQRARAAASEVRQAVAAVVHAQERLAIDTRSAALAAETRDDVRRAYEAEKAALTRLNEAQRDAVAAAARLAQARIQLRQAWSALRAAAGGREPDQSSQ